MSKTQTNLLLELAEKIKQEEPSKKAVINSLHSAGIVTEQGEITESFPNLKRILSVAE